MKPQSPSTSSVDEGGGKLYHAGTLTYTKPALAILFFWLLWGDFCYTVMEAVTTPIMNLKFAALGASNTERNVLVTVVPSLVYSVLAPVIAFRSDRHRGRLGRRIPFLLFSLPFLVGFLACLAFGDSIGHGIYRLISPWVKTISANEVVILTFAAILVVFTFFNTFVSTTFWYLFNDVVPEHLIARFFSWFRFISTLSTSLYYFAIFPSSGTHDTEIFLGAAVLYAVGFGLMCYNVREGKYPPPAPYVGGGTGPLAAVRTFGAETHAFRHYVYLWINVFIGGVGGATATSDLFFWLAIGLSKQQIGDVQSAFNIVVAVLTLGAGWLADRYHPIRVVIFGSFLSFFVVTPANLIWLFWHPTTNAIFWTFLAMRLGLTAPHQALANMWDPPFLMRFLPRSRYGQFCSVNGVWRMLGGILGATLVGIYLDLVGQWVGPQRAYFYLPLWTLFFAAPCLFLQLKMYASWKNHGGDDHYEAPVLTGNTMEEERVMVPDVPIDQEAAANSGER